MSASLIVASDAQALRIATQPTVPVLLHGRRGALPDGGTVGGNVAAAIRALPAPPSQAAYDLLSIALAVVAADTFVRRKDAPDGWTRDVKLRVSIVDLAVWRPLIGKLERALGFLSGDRWQLELVGGGPLAPQQPPRLATEDCVCLFSGGLDSTIGAFELVRNGRSPLLVSHAYPKEGPIQSSLRQALGRPLHHLSTNVDPQLGRGNETSMRPRSFLFIALGAVAASSLASARRVGSVECFMPENGLISLNAPLTKRRIGSHSTRTTHPWFIGQIMEIFSAAGLPAQIENPYQFMTKGEMLGTALNNPALVRHAATTVSCGKWKRKNTQCGRCFPCLIRRAAFHAAGISDHTTYKSDNLRTVLLNTDEHDDLLAVRLAAAKLGSANLDAWIAHAGPLPENPQQRQPYINVFRRGMQELKGFLISQNCYP